MSTPTLYIVATPIGNLDDISIRAIETLKNVDYILSEDTRETVKILNKYNIKNPQISYRDQNHNRVIPRILEMLSAGMNLALTTDGGTPLISDPGFKLVNEVTKKGYSVVPIPGPSALTTALSISPVPTDKFCFLGFLPRKQKQKEDMLRTYGSLDATLIIFESPYRVIDTLGDILKILGDRAGFICRELTKIHETTYTGYISSLLEQLGTQKQRGEFIILVAKEDFSY